MATHETILMDPVLSSAVTKWATARRDEIGHLSGEQPDDIDTTELVQMWADLDRLQRELSVWVRDLALAVGSRIADMEDRALDHPQLGRVEVHQTRKGVAWDGARVLSLLAGAYADPGSGELVDAISVETLRKVLPACGPGATSSKWKATALPDVVVERCRTSTGFGPPLPKIV